MGCPVNASSRCGAIPATSTGVAKLLYLARANRALLLDVDGDIDAQAWMRCVAPNGRGSGSGPRHTVLSGGNIEPTSPSKALIRANRFNGCSAR